MLEERNYTDMSRYPKAVNSDWQAAVDEYLEEVGATDLDAPDAPKRKIQRTDVQLCAALEGQKRREAEARAQAEHQAALARLADGTAIHRQAKERTPVPVKKKVKAVTPAKPKATKPASAKPMKAKTRSTSDIAVARRKRMTETLKAGGKIKNIQQIRGKGIYAEHQQQYLDFKEIMRKEKVSIARINRIGDEHSYFVIDSYPRYQMTESINGRADDKDKMLKALLSRQMVLSSDIAGTRKDAARTITSLAQKHDFDIYTVFHGRIVTGWIFIPDEEKRKAKLKKLGHMLDALDFLKERKQREENERLTNEKTPQPILEAAYREFKRVAKDAGATIEEVLAVKESQ